MMDHRARVRSLQQSLADQETDRLLVTDLTNVRYLSGFSGTNGQVLVVPEGSTFLTDTRYRARSADLVTTMPVEIYENSMTEVLPRLLAAGPLGIESAAMTLQDKADLEKKLPDHPPIGLPDLLSPLRRVKDEAEIAAMREAARLADEALAQVLATIRPGSTEREIALEIEIEMRRRGADSVAFEPIVGSGPLSAHIHHSPSSRTVEKGDLIILDLGARFEGYCSDLTRTVVVGPATELQKEIYATVLAAQEAGIEAARAGAPCKEVDAAARHVIEAAGYGPDFGHGTGHGVGLEIHESPRLNRFSEEVLGLGDAVTIEPGIYLPGSGGIRIEDCLVVHDHGNEVLGHAPKDELIEL